MKRKFSDRPVAVAAPLKPFISGDNSAEGQIDVDSGLYNFLSPSLAPDGHEEVKEIIIQSAPALERSQSEIIDASEALQPIIERRKVLRSSVSAPPEWYQKGREIEALLKEAESLDWEREKFAAAVAVLTNQKSNSFYMLASL